MVEYAVRIQYKVDDGASGPIDKIADKAKRVTREKEKANATAGMLADTIRTLGSFATGAFDSVVSGAAKGSVALAGMAAVATAGAIKTGISVNAAVEDSTISFASIFRMFDVTKNFDEGLAPAKDLIAGIRKDAAALPGEFQDFVDMSQTIMPAMLGMGKSVADVRTNVSQLAAAAASVGLKGKQGFAQAAREYAELLEGRAGTHNLLGLKMGITAHSKVGGVDFNKTSGAARYDFVQESLKKAGEALPAFEKSWSGLTSTLADNFKAFLGRATAPLMDRMKVSIDRFSKFFESRSGDAADRVADALVAAYDWAERKTLRIASHWSEIKSAGQSLERSFEKVYGYVSPLVDKIGGLASKAFANPGAALGDALALRAGVGILGGAAPEAMAASGGAVAAGAGVAAAAVGVALIDDVGGSVNRTGTILNGWWTGLLGLFDSAASKGAFLRDALGGIGAVILWGMDVAFTPFRILIGGATLALQGLNAVWDKLKEGASEVYNEMWGVKEIVDTVSGAIGGFTSNLSYLWKQLKGMISDNTNYGANTFTTAKEQADFQIDASRKAAGVFENFGFLNYGGGGSKNLAELKGSMKAAGGKGATNINVNAPITVLAESDPDRLVAKVGTHLERVLRAPTRSIAARSFMDQ